MQPLGGAHIDDVVLDQQIGPLDQLDAHLIGQEGVLVIGAVEGARGQQDDDGVALAIGRRHRFQRLPQLLRIVGDRGDPVLGAEIGQQAHHRLAVLQHVGDARGGAAIVLEDIEFLGPCAHEIDAGDMGIGRLRRGEILHLRAKPLVVQDQHRIDAARADELALMVDVVEEGVDGAHALLQAALEIGPFGGVEDARDDVEGDQPLGVAALLIDGEGDADPAEQ